MFLQRRQRHFRSSRRWAMVAVAVLFFHLGANAQEALRASLAGEDAAEARRRATSTLGYYNLKLGPVGLRFSAGLGVDFTDNVNLGGASNTTAAM